MTVTVNLQFASVAEAISALSRLSGEPHFESGAPVILDPAHRRAVDAGKATAHPVPGGTIIEYRDRPDVGNGHAGDPPAPSLPMIAPAVAPSQDPAVVFGGAVAPAAPTPPVAPTAPPAPSAPTVATVPTAAPATVELDSTGLPWDARIHASTKSKVGAGAWTAKRGVDPAFKAQIEADLRGTPAPQVAAPAPVAPPAPVAAPAAPAAPVAPAAAAPAAPADAISFAAYMAQVGAYFSARPVDSHTHMATALGEQGMQHVGQLAVRPDLIPAVDARFKQLMG